MGLEFVEDGHRYFYEGKEIPSVSEILRFISREVYKEADKTAMDFAADRGTRVHAACAELDERGSAVVDEDITGYVSAYANFLNDHRVKWEKIEEPRLGINEEYAGTIDRYGVLDDRPALLDIKTTKKISKKHKLLYETQLTLYNWTFNIIDYNFEIYNYILKLNDDGTYKLIPAENQEAMACACLDLHKAFEKTKRRKKTNG